MRAFNESVYELEGDRLFQYFELCLKDYDWTHAMSDSHRVYKRGEAQWNMIKDVREKCEETDFERSEEVYQRYRNEAWGLKKGEKDETLPGPDSGDR